MAISNLQIFKHIFFVFLATQFGIALPSWIVDKKNAMWVLGAYMLAFIVILPIVVVSVSYRAEYLLSDDICVDDMTLAF